PTYPARNLYAPKRGNTFPPVMWLRILQRQKDGFHDPPHLFGEPLMKRIATCLATTLLAWPALAHTPQQPPHQSYSEGDFRLESGEAIKDFAISYVTHGTLNAKKSNAILMVTAISGNHHRIDFMIGPGKALDSAK